MSRQSLAISIGDVLILDKFLFMSFLGGNSGAGSCALDTEDFDAKKRIKYFCLLLWVSNDEVIFNNGGD